MKTNSVPFVRSTYVVVLMHLIAWLCFFCVPFLLLSIQMDKQFFILRFAIPNLLLASFFYANMLFLVPHYLQAQKQWTYISIVFISVSMLSVSDAYLESYYFKNTRRIHQMDDPRVRIRVFDSPDKVITHFPKEGLLQTHPAPGLTNSAVKGTPIPHTAGAFFVIMPYTFVVLKSLLLSLLALAISTSLKITGEWYKNEQQRKAMENERLQSELTFLKSQVNPHFFFNTLNNIYSLANSKSDDAPLAIARLSQLMRYMLYESNVNLVLLSREIEYLHSFIDLQKLRFSNDTHIDFIIEGETEDKMIAPMLLIPFVENAFKHGITHQQNPDIHLSLQAKDRQLIFNISNTFEKGPHIEDRHKGGIGLQNIKRRLNLLYPQSHQLHIHQQENTFFVELVLILS